MSADSPNHPDRVHPRTSFAEPLIAVVDAEGTLGAWIGALCGMLRVDVTIATDAAMLSKALEVRPPLAIVCGELNDPGSGVSTVLKLVANYNPCVPLMLITRDDPETLGRVDAAMELWPLTHVERHSGHIRIESLLDFIARAGRDRGSMRLMPI